MNNEIIEQAIEDEIREVTEGNTPNYRQTLNQIKEMLMNMPKPFRHTLYLWLSKEFGIFK